MSGAPSAKSLAAFLVGFWVVLSVAEGPLWALVGSEMSLHDRVNALRREHHLNALAPSDALARVARGHAEDMARNGFFDHVNLSGQNPLNRVQSAGIDGFRLLAENIGSSNVSGDRVPAVISAWLNSPIHRENLLNPAFNTSGIAVVDSDDGQTLIVQLYATFPSP